MSERRAAAGTVWSLICITLVLSGFVAALTALAGPIRHPAAVDRIASQGVVELTVVVTSDPVVSEGGRQRGDGGDRSRFRARLETVAPVARAGSGERTGSGGAASTSTRDDASVAAATRLAVPVTVFAAVPAAVAAPRIGERWRFEGTLRWNAWEDTSAALAFARSEPVRTETASAGIAWASFLRTGFSIVSESLPGDGGALLPGLALGDTSRVGSELDDAMKASSLSHLTAVSGANCAIIVWLVLAAAARCGLPLAARTVVALVALGGFVVLVTPQPSVQRAAFMAAVVLVAGGIGRPARGIAALSLAVIVLLATDPWLSREIGFALSVLATLGLIVVARPLSMALGRVMPMWLATLIAVPLAAQLACQPVLLLLDPTLALGGVAANLLAGPAAAPGTVIGLIACIAAAAWPQLGLVVAWIAWVPSAWIAAIAHWFAGVPGARVPWVEGPMGVALLALPTLAVVLLVVRGGAMRRVARWVCVGVIACTVAGLGGHAAGTAITTAVTRPADWFVAACEVGQGDAVLVQDPTGEHALVDVGPEPEPLTACLDALGIDRVELLVLTHYDADHVGGLEAILGRVDLVLVGPTADATDERILRELREHGADVARGEAGLTGRLGDTEWSVLWPAPPRVGPVETGNDASVVVRFDRPGGPDRAGDALPPLSAMFLGDLGEATQNRLLARHTLGDAVDIVKVAHHGSADQSERLYRRLDADIGLLSVGADNGYGHPTASILGVLETLGAVSLRTDELGMILLAPAEAHRPDNASASSFRVWTERAPP
ncbi:ComEC/Rec2 family competence protein [Plantibacter sp. YIM 135249]|uniref:ComEC/Rec2 family competence protein n=1 Tax=Plantibacter sp. YIM 135249 TaxID=3423918 RepID=UPI003D32B2CE